MARVKPSGLAKELKKVGSLATKREMTVILHKLSIDSFRELVIRSAADTGFLRSNWDVAIGTAPDGRIRDIEGGVFSDATWPSVRLQVGDNIVLYNNTEYVGYLEFGTPYMRAQPMVTPTYYSTLSQAKVLTKALSRKKVK